MHEQPASTDPLIGQVVGNYRVERRLGVGGMGAVYLVQHVLLPETRAALKVLTCTTGHNLHERFEQEARAASAAGSHRVVRPLDTGTLPDGTRYILMEYVDGRSLADELRSQGPLAIELALKIACRVADTMALAHRKGIVHRDLKPANIMLTQEGDRSHVVKILDFGVARATGALKLVETSQHTIVGTPGYMSPEAATGCGTDGRSDVFSLGVILFEMLTGLLPFPPPEDEAHFQASVLNLLAQPTPSAAALRRSVPPAIDALLRGALAREPARRFTMAQFEEALLAALAGLERAAGVVGTPMQTMLSASTAGPSGVHAAPTLNVDVGKISSLLRKLTPNQVPTVIRQAAVTPIRQGAVTPIRNLALAPRRRGRRWLWGAVMLLVIAGGAVVVQKVVLAPRPRVAPVAVPARAAVAPPSPELPSPTPPPSPPRTRHSRVRAPRPAPERYAPPDDPFGAP
jgi:serine/threonine-protein kinase